MPGSVSAADLPGDGRVVLRFKLGVPFVDELVGTGGGNAEVFGDFRRGDENRIVGFHGVFLTFRILYIFA